MEAIQPYKNVCVEEFVRLTKFPRQKTKRLCKEGIIPCEITGSRYSFNYYEALRVYQERANNQGKQTQEEEKKSGRKAINTAEDALEALGYSRKKRGKK